MINLHTLPPLGLYIHIPWCVKKCPYCDFNSHQVNYTDFNTLETDYINCVLKDLELAMPSIWGRMVSTVFIGGGTPSLFSGSAIHNLLNGVRSMVNLSPYAEITLEANPGTLDLSNFNEYKKAGVNRLSIGVQSFNDVFLKSLGRVHDGKTAINTVNTALEIFEFVNVDIMYVLPNQDIQDAIKDINSVIFLNPNHISCYNLTIEPNTYFYTNTPKNLPDNDICFAMQEEVINILKDAKYDRYEISAFAKNKTYAQHNLNYWTFGDYLGIGAGAHSKISYQNKIIREIRHKNPTQYMKSIVNNTHIIETREVKNHELPFEFAMNGLRLIDGVPVSWFTERTGLPLNAILPKLQEAESKSFINLKGNMIIPTPHGVNFLNDALLLFLA